MIDLSDIRVFLCTMPTKMSYSFDSLRGLAQQIFDQDPLSGHLFLFVSRDRDRLKILFWDHDGLAIFYKRLEAGTFQLPKPNRDRQGVELDEHQFSRLLRGGLPGVSSLALGLRGCRHNDNGVGSTRQHPG
jgi:transposase